MQAHSALHNSESAKAAQEMRKASSRATQSGLNKNIEFELKFCPRCLASRNLGYLLRVEIIRLHRQIASS